MRGGRRDVKGDGDVVLLDVDAVLDDLDELRAEDALLDELQGGDVHKDVDVALGQHSVVGAQDKIHLEECDRANNQGAQKQPHVPAEQPLAENIPD